jgi:hypothetical protein
VPSGNIPGDQLAAYLLELCARPGVTAFGALIYDESSIALRKLFRDPDYWDALDKASGPNFEIFAIRDTEDYYNEQGIERITAASLSRSRSRGYYFSHLLKRYFGEDRTTLAYPSLLLFLVEQGQVKYCRLIPFRNTSFEETFNRLSALLSAIASGIEEAGGSGTGLNVLWEHLKTKLLNLKYKLYIQHSPRNATEAVQKLAAYVEK